MLLSAVSVLVVGQSSSEILEGLMNNPVFISGIGVSAINCCINERHGCRGRIEGFANLILSRGTGWRLVAGFTP